MTDPKPAALAALMDESERSLILRDGGSLGWLLFESEFDALQAFIQILEDFLEGQERAEVEYLKSSPHALHAAYWAENFPYHYNHLLAPQLRKSFIPSLLGLTEVFVRVACGDVSTIVRPPIEYGDLKGSYLTRARKFLVAFAGFKTPTDAQWENVRALYLIRNSIAHDGGRTRKGEQQRIARLLKASGHGTLDEGVVELERGFCEYAHARVTEFFEAMRMELKALCQKAQRHEQA